MNGQTARSAHLNILDVFIVLIFSSVLNIFIFWIATQFIGYPVFERIPNFVSGFYSKIWAAVGTGVGIGLLLYKHLKKGNIYNINYFSYVILTSIGMFLVITLVSIGTVNLIKPKEVISRQPKMPVPPSAFRLDLPPDGTEQSFSDDTALQFGNDRIVVFEFNIKMKLKNKVFSGTLFPSILTTSKTYRPPPGAVLQRVSVNACYHKFVDRNWRLERIPSINSQKNSRKINIELNPGMSRKIPGFNFQFDAPIDVDLDALWLCFQFDYDGGLIPL